MNRNQQSPIVPTNLSASATFDVAGTGDITPTTQQTVDPGQSIQIQRSASATSTYGGYICAWQNGCKCSTIISDLGTEPHMKVHDLPTLYGIKSNAPTGEYTIYATPSENGSGPLQTENNGDLRVGH